MAEKVKISELPALDRQLVDDDLFISSDEIITTKITANQIAEHVANSDIMKTEYVKKDEIGSPEGVAPLDNNGKLPGNFVEYGDSENTAYEGLRGSFLEKEFVSHKSDEEIHVTEEEKKKIHFHNNMDVIDSITQDMINKLNNIGSNIENKNKYFGISRNGLYYSDDDLVTFSKIEDYNDISFKSIIYVEEKEMLVATEGKNIIYSHDGISWTTINVSNSINNVFYLYDIAYGNGHFVCVGSYGLILYSVDCINWHVANGYDKDVSLYNRVVYCNDRFIVIGREGKSYYSIDGENWNEMTGLNKSVDYSDIEYGNNRFVCISNYSVDNNCAYSIDGETWICYSFERCLSRIAYGNGYFVITGIPTDAGDVKTYYSVDGITLNEMSGIVTKEFGLYNVVYVNNQFYLFAQYNIYYSQDGKTWTLLSNNKCGIEDVAFCYNNNNSNHNSSDVYVSDTVLISNPSSTQAVTIAENVGIDFAKKAIEGKLFIIVKSNYSIYTILPVITEEQSQYRISGMQLATPLTNCCLLNLIISCIPYSDKIDIIYNNFLIGKFTSSGTLSTPTTSSTTGINIKVMCLP